MKNGKRPKGFWKRHFWPRRKKVLLHRHLVFAILGGSVMSLVTTFWGSYLGTADLKFSAVSTALLAFAALSFGGCVTGATVAIALPSDRLMTTMAVNGSDSPAVRVTVTDGRMVAQDEQGVRVTAKDFERNFQSLYQDLVFTFIYSGVVQLILALVSVVVLVFVGDETMGAAAGCDWWRKVANFVLTTAFIYSLLQLMASLSALLSIANSRDRYARNDLGLYHGDVRPSACASRKSRILDVWKDWCSR